MRKLALVVAFTLNLIATSVSATHSWPKVNVPANYIVTRKYYVWDTKAKTLTDQQEYSIEKASSDLNSVYEEHHVDRTGQ